jgi:hypothetical protein
VPDSECPSQLCEGCRPRPPTSRYARCWVDGRTVHSTTGQRRRGGGGYNQLNPTSPPPPCSQWNTPSRRCCAAYAGPASRPIRPTCASTACARRCALAAASLYNGRAAAADVASDACRQGSAHSTHRPEDGEGFVSASNPRCWVGTTRPQRRRVPRRGVHPRTTGVQPRTTDPPARVDPPHTTRREMHAGISHPGPSQPLRSQRRRRTDSRGSDRLTGGPAPHCRRDTALASAAEGPL